jgi:hypothetical protein
MVINADRGRVALPGPTLPGRDEADQGEREMQTYTDPASGRQYTVDPATGESRWLDQIPTQAPPPPLPPSAMYGQPQPQQPAKSKHTGLKVIGGIVGVVVLLAIAGSCAGGGGTTSTSVSGSTRAASSRPESASVSAAAKPSGTTAKASAIPGIGRPVRDGKFEFTVIGVKTAKQVGNDFMNKKAQGQFLLVSMTVRNIGDKAQMFDSSSQKLFDAAGREYAADSAAAVYLGDANSFLNTINPGNSVKGIVVFDIPTGAKIARVELHDSLFSGGVGVRLAK